MKSFILLSSMLLSMFLANAQTLDSLSTGRNEEMYDYFIRKHESQKKTGFILLGSGVAAIVGGVLMINNSSFDDAEFTAGGILYLGGILSTAASVPVLIISGSNRRKAETYLQAGTFHMQGIEVPNQKAVALGLKINF